MPKIRFKYIFWLNINIYFIFIILNFFNYVFAQEISNSRIIGVGTGTSTAEYTDNDLKVQLNGPTYCINNYTKINLSGINLTTGFSKSNLSGKSQFTSATTEFNYEVNIFELGYGYGFNFGIVQIDTNFLFGIGQGTYQFKIFTTNQGNFISPKRKSTLIKTHISIPITIEYWDNLVITFIPSSGTSFDRFKAGNAGTALLSIKSGAILMLGGYM